MKTGVTAAVLVLVPALSQAMPELQEGKWRFEISYNFVGVPQHFPNYTKFQCISRENPMPDISRPGHECRRDLQGKYGQTYTWTENCSTDWEVVQGIGRIHYLSDVAQGDVHLQVINPFNPPQPMIFRINGQWLGECDE